MIASILILVAVVAAMFLLVQLVDSLGEGSEPSVPWDPEETS